MKRFLDVETGFKLFCQWYVKFYRPVKHSPPPYPSPPELGDITVRKYANKSVNFDFLYKMT